MPQRGLRADESYSAVLVGGSVSTGAARSGAPERGARAWDRRGAGAAGAGCAAGACAGGVFMRSAGARLSVVTLPGGPTCATVAEPTVILSDSGLPALSIGAVAVVGTV